MKRKSYKIDISRIIQELNHEKYDEDKEIIAESNEEDKTSLPDYGSAEFWEKRYKIEFLPFDWYIQWNELKPVIDSYIPADKQNLKSLVVGCGNSTMSNDMVTMSGFKHVVSIDISTSVIEKMKRRYKSECLEWITMDVTEMKFEDESFDLVFDKGTVDALTCADNVNSVIKKTSNELYRVLKPNGFLIMITYEKPFDRISLMKHTMVPWKIETVLFIPNNPKNADDDQATYVYMFHK